MRVCTCVWFCAFVCVCVGGGVIAYGQIHWEDNGDFRVVRWRGCWLSLHNKGVRGEMLLMSLRSAICVSENKEGEKPSAFTSLLYGSHQSPANVEN